MTLQNRSQRPVSDHLKWLLFPTTVASLTGENEFDLKLAPVVSRAVLKVGFDPTFGETKTTERASGKESIASWFNEPAEPEPESAPVTAPESAPDHDGERADPDVIDLLSDDEAGASE